MKKIMKNEKFSGKLYKASAAQYTNEKVYGFLLTEEEAESTCFFGAGEAICSTCNPDNCPWFEERE